MFCFTPENVQKRCKYVNPTKVLEWVPVVVEFRFRPNSIVPPNSSSATLTRLGTSGFALHLASRQPTCCHSLSYLTMETGRNGDVHLTAFSPTNASGHQRDDGSHLEHRRSSAGEDSHGQEFSLPRVDGGRNAWLCLAGCFCIEALVWGRQLALTLS